MEYFCTMNTPALFIKALRKVQDVIHTRKRDPRKHDNILAPVREYRGVNPVRVHHVRWIFILGRCFLTFYTT